MLDCRGEITVKILVDEFELNEAFELVSDLRNHITKDHPVWFKLQLQKACNILGPMWAAGVDMGKILIERSLIEKAAKLLWSSHPGDAEAARKILVDILQAPVNVWKFVPGNTPNGDITYKDRRWADEAIQKHDDSQIPVRSKEQNIKTIKEALAQDPGKISISPMPKSRADPRCDGCEFQHPYAENLSCDIAAGKVYCNRGVTPIYYKEGRTIRYPPNLMICDMYYLNNGKLAKFGTEWNPPCAQYCIPEVEKIMEREVSNHRAIIEILDMLDSSSCSRGWNRTTELRSKVKTLKAKMIEGEIK